VTLQTLSLGEAVRRVAVLTAFAKDIGEEEYYVPVSLWGDYESLTTHGSRFYGVFTGTSIGRSVVDSIRFSSVSMRMSVYRVRHHPQSFYLFRHLHRLCPRQDPRLRRVRSYRERSIA
jgi:hypothetical protein